MLLQPRVWFATGRLAAGFVLGDWGRDQSEAVECQVGRGAALAATDPANGREFSISLSVSCWEGAQGRQLADGSERQRRQQQLLPGVGVDARVKWSLDAMRRAWLEASLGYRWVTETGVVRLN